MGNTKIDEFVRASQHARRGGYKTASALFYRRAGLWFEARVNAIYSAALAEDVITAKLLLQQYRDRLPTRSAEKICALIRSRLFKQPRPTMGRIRGTSQPLVSVIVPVRNAARYLSHCLESIVRQDYQNIEVLVVDDGSTDQSRDIIRAYALRDPRVRPYFRAAPSGNPGTPRNEAIEKAFGEYLVFVDSDDWLERDYIGCLVAKALEDDADLVFSGGFNNHRGGTVETRLYESSWFDDELSPLYRYHQSFMIWDKLYSTRFIRQYGLRLGETPGGADVPFILAAYYYCSRPAFCEGLIGYNYRRETPDSVTVRLRRGSSCSFEAQAFDVAEAWATKEMVEPWYIDLIRFRRTESYLYTLSVISEGYYEQFFAHARTVFRRLDLWKIGRLYELCRKLNKRKNVDLIAKSIFVPQECFRQARDDQGAIDAPAGRDRKLMTDKPGEGEDGIIFYPDWSIRNPYQRALYQALHRRYGQPIVGLNGRLWDFAWLSSLRNKFKYIHIHWLHTLYDPADPFAAQSLIENVKEVRELGYRIIWTVHNYTSHDSVTPEYEAFIRRRFVQYCDYILVHGEVARSFVIERWGAPSDRVFVVPHGSYEGVYPNTVSREAARQHFGYTEEDVVFLFFGNIKGYKGLDALLGAYRRIAADGKRAKLLVAGRIFEQEYKSVLEDAATWDGVTIHEGFVPEASVQYYFNAADAVVLPYTNILTSGVSVLSLTFRVPQIAPAVGLLPEIVRRGVGVLYSSYDEMYRYMCQVIEAKHKGELPLGTSPEAFDEELKKLQWDDLVSRPPFKSVFGDRARAAVATHKSRKERCADRPRVVLYRILGNEIPGRHSPRQSVTNLRFMLENEPEFAHCEKIWVLNRIMDRERRDELVAILEQYGKEYIEIPFLWEEYAKTTFDYSHFGRSDFKLTDAFAELGEREQALADCCIYWEKNLYVMNNNAARNFALRHGRGRADWVMPWDGNCFLTSDGWAAIYEAIRHAGAARYLIVPMYRLVRNDDVFAVHPAGPAEEPQIAFRKDASEEFDEELPYGFKPKVELLKRLKVPGAWDGWGQLHPWRRLTTRVPKGPIGYIVTGWVARLASGNDAAETSMSERALSREKGIVQLLREADEQAVARRFARDRLAFYNEQELSHLQHAVRTTCSENIGILGKIIKHADECLHDRTYSVTYKTSLPPSGNPHDYWHPAPYAWPNPNTPDGLPYIHRDGERVPGTQLYDTESIKYDRSSVQRLFDETTLLALGWAVTGMREYIEKAYRLIRVWFIEERTRMNPHLEYAQVVMGRNGNRGTKSGLIETKDFYYFLDAVRLVRQSEFWTKNDENQFNEWCENFLSWLVESEQGRAECRSKNNHGVAYDLQTLSFALYLGNVALANEIVGRALSRMPTHFTRDGEQPEELRRQTSAHYTTFNLQLWLNLAHVIHKFNGQNILELGWKYENGVVVNPVVSGLDWLLPYYRREWPYTQIDSFNKERLAVLYYQGAYYSDYLVGRYGNLFPELSLSTYYLYPHDGAAPFWNLAVRFAEVAPDKRGCYPSAWSDDAENGKFLVAR